MDKKIKALIAPLLCCIFCFFIWGSQPVYWAKLSGFDTMFIMCVRVTMAVFFTWLYLISAGRFGELKATFKDKKSMKLLAPASVFLCADWALFIWAVNAGHVIDSNLGYYFNPLVIFLVGVFVFKEKSHFLEYVAVGIACLGIVISTVRSSSLPYISICFALVWPVYATIKKHAKADPTVSFAVEAALMLPFALAAIFIFFRGEGGLSDITGSNLPFLIGSGLVTALPMILYNTMVNSLPFKVVGVLQYLGTTIGFICGILMGEELTTEKIIIFVCIWIGLITFTLGNARKNKTL